ncbi:MAG TPA: LssY C-terminal domain-containing protein [Gemmatimonadales bacterium]|nr:LssY C-terminal domain-containing protein [Gemmatimonadales bacterium]
MTPALLAAILLLAQGPRQASVLPAGTAIPIRFPESIEGGREKVGTVVLLQTTGPLAALGCAVVPAFARVAATVLVSRPARSFGRRGRLELRFDSLAAGRAWVPLAAVLDSLEWAARGTLTRQGELVERPRSLRGVVGTAGAVGLAGAATGVGVVPVFVLTGVNLALRGGQAHILAGQRGWLRLSAPLEVPAPARCEPAVSPWVSAAVPAVPALPPQATDKRGTTTADPINLLFRGTRAELDTAFERAGWTAAKRSTFGALAVETEAIVLQRSDTAAPMSHEYYLGRVEDLRYERASLSARARHHARLWRADASDTLWAAAATEDIGVLVSARRRTVTHRIAADIDRERDLLVGDLLAGGCVVLEGYATLPGAKHAGTSVAHQPYVTDARAAVLRASRCATSGRKGSGLP